MKQIIFTSFKRSARIGRQAPNAICVSIAVYQPTSFHYPKIEEFDIRRKDGVWLRPRLFLGFKQPLAAYREALYEQYRGRAARIKAAIRKLLRSYDTVILCCWCPYEKAAQRQIKDYGTFVCHSAVVYRFLADQLTSVHLVLDEDRREKMHMLW